MSELEPERLRPLLRGGLGEPYLYAAETPSTQDILRDGDYAHGAVAVAEHQTAGRGRSGRRWDDAPSTALLFSVLLRPPAGAALPQLSLVVGLAVAEAIEHVSGVRALVKWPNDVLVEGGKVAGILLEATGGDVVCGVGINVNQVEHDLPPVTRAPATSLRLAAGRPLDRGIVLTSVLSRARTALHGLAGRWPRLPPRGARAAQYAARPEGARGRPHRDRGRDRTGRTTHGRPRARRHRARRERRGRARTGSRATRETG